MKSNRRNLIRPWHGLIAIVLLLVNQAAMALGLGEIRVLSRPGQPFVAEIPVISNAPGELEHARARLASDDTFQRVGLPRPQGTVRNLQFQITQNAQGQAIIRVTSPTAADVEALSFLIEVDWEQGRLVREYSALLNTPQTVTAPETVPVRGPETGQTNIIERPPVASAPPDPLPDDTFTQVPPPSLPPPAEPSPPPGPPPVVPSPRTPSPSRTAVAANPDGSMTVQQGQNLSQIAAQTRFRGYTLNQTMLGLLRANPNAFIDGNINRLRAGAVLRMPTQEQLAELDAAAAAALVQEQAAQWRQARSPIVQPADTGRPVNGTSGISSVDSIADAASGTTRSEDADGLGGTPTDDARLEIAPPVALDGDVAGTVSGMAAGGEGDMLITEQLRQAKEDLAARESELDDLRSRVDELEHLHEQQAQLIEMKNTQLAAAEDRLRQSNEEAGSALPWFMGGVILLLLGAVGWLWTQRRKPAAVPTMSGGFDAMVEPPPPDDMPPPPPSAYGDDFDHFASRQTTDEAPVPETVPVPVPEPVDQNIEGIQAYADALVRSRIHAQETVGQEQNVSPGQESAPGIDALLKRMPNGRERLDLASAYLDLGDVETARDLLTEVAQGDDSEAGEEARRRLQQMG